MTNPDAAILNDIASYYAKTLGRFGPTAKGVDWNGNESHELRHRQFLRLFAGDLTKSVIDLGCGFGDFYRFLKIAGHTGDFAGYDVSSDMIEAARHLYGATERSRWTVGSAPTEAADLAIASGIFNVKGDVGDRDWRHYVERTIDVLARASRQGFAFNVLSLSSDPARRQPHLFYADPIDVLSYCLRRFGRNVALLQDYGLYEFTIIVRHETP